MNKTIKKFVSFLCMAVLIVSAVAIGASAAVAELDASVKLETEADALQDKVVITVNPEASDSWTTITVTTADGCPVELIQQKTEDGNVFEIYLSGKIPPSEDVVVKISTSPSEKVKKYVQKYYTFELQQQAIRDILDPTLAITQEIADIISLELDGDFSLISSNGILFLKEKLAEQFAQQLEAQTPIVVKEFNAALENKIALSILSGMNAEIIRPYMEREKTALGIASLYEYGWYSSISSDAEKTARIVSRLATRKYSSTEDFVNAFKAENFLDEFSTKHSTEAVNFISNHIDEQLENGEAINLDWTEYGNLQPGQKEYFSGLIAGKRYDSLSTFAADFDANIVTASEYTEQQDTPTVTPPVTTIPGVSLPGNSLGVIGGGGGSAGGGAAATPVVPQVVPEKPAETGFKDVESVPWAKEAIAALAKEGVINGVGEGNFDPEGLVTREQYIKMIVGAFNVKAAETDKNFEDVPSGEWYSDFIKIAVSNGIINGVSDSNFGIGANISRQDMAVVIYRTAKMLGYELAAKTQDVPADIDEIADYAKDAVTALYQAGIINGVGEGKFAPADTATRAQAAKIIFELRGLN